MKREIIIGVDCARVQLTRGYEAIIDFDDIELICGFNWNAQVKTRRDGSVLTVYACRMESVDGKKKMVHMHRVIAKTADGFETDHIDGDGLNNRRNNLRSAGRAENQHNQRLSIRNKSGIKGVSWSNSKSRWVAQIMINGAYKYLGAFNSISDASVAYESASKLHHGDFGRTDKSKNPF